MQHDIIYSKLFGDGSDGYKLESDYRLMWTSSSQYGKTRPQLRGTWSRKDSLIVLHFSKEPEREYKADSILTLHFLVGTELIKEWEIIKSQVLQDLSKHDLYQMVLTDISKNDQKEWAIKQIRASSFRNYIIRANILIEDIGVPPLSKKKKKSNH